MVDSDKLGASAWPQALIRWFKTHRRPMPWGRRETPYRVWVGVVMLQQTRVDQMAPYYARFIRRFPSLHRLAKADLNEVLRVWEGLGYYARARHMHQTAQILDAQGQGRLPKTATAWRQLPGVGEYTAAAVASICYGEPIPAVDGNVRRVAARLWTVRADVRRRAVSRRLVLRLTLAMRGVSPSLFNQGLMELGAAVCLPRKPQCSCCPLRTGCAALARGWVHRIPRRRSRPTVPHRRVAAAVVWRNGRILITRRRPDQMLGGLWEFPGGKQEPGETLVETIRREIREETGLFIRVIRPYITIRHQYSHLRVTLTAFACVPVRGRARALAVAAVRWVRPEELARYPFPRANRRIAEVVLKTGPPAVDKRTR